MSTKKRKRPAVVQDYIDNGHGFLFSVVKDEKKNILYSIPRRAVQSLCRDVVRGVIIREMENEPIGLLLPSSVEVRDRRAFLPAIGSQSDSSDYVGGLKKFIETVYGTDEVNEERDDFIHKLTWPKLSGVRLQGLYFHIFLLNEEDRVDFCSEMVHNLRNITIPDGTDFLKWTDAFLLWHSRGPAEVINLSNSCKNDIWANQVYTYKNKKQKYPQTCVGEAELARNIAIHVNERRQNANPPAPLLNKRQIGHVIYKVLPNICMKLFNFMWESGVDMDFKKSLSNAL